MPNIRPYRPEDRADAATVFYRAVREGAAAHYPATELAAWATSPEPDWTQPDKLVDQWCFVAEDDGRMTGFFSMDDTGYLDMAFVIPEVMGNVLRRHRGRLRARLPDRRRLERRRDPRPRRDECARRNHHDPARLAQLAASSLFQGAGLPENPEPRPSSISAGLGYLRALSPA